MGKVKHTKQRNDPYLGGKNNRNDSSSQNKFSDVITDLAALDASKRAKACSTLAGVYYFNVSNKSNLATLTTTNILNLLSMRLVDNSKEVRKEAAIAVHNLSECNEKDVFTRTVNVGLFQRTIASVQEPGALENANGTFVEQLLFSISNTILNNPSTLQELARSGASFVDFVVGLLSMNVPHNCITAAAQLLCALTNVKSNPNAACVVNLESLIARVWAFSRDLNFHSSGNSTTLILIQCSEILCNAFLQCDLSNQQMVQDCHLSEVLPYLVGLLRTIPASQSSEGAEGVGGLTLIKVVANTLLNVMEPFQGASSAAATSEEQEEVTSVDIEEARAGVIPSLSESARRKYEMTSSLLGAASEVTSAFTGALSRVTAAVKQAVADSLVVTTSEGNGEEDVDEECDGEGHGEQSTPMVEASAAVTAAATTGAGETTTSIVINKQVLNAVDCLEQLLTSYEHFTLFKATCGEFAVEVEPLLELGQYLLELVGHVTTTATPTSNGNSSNSTNNPQQQQQLPWTYADDVSENAVKDAIVSSTSSLLDFLSQLIKVSHNSCAAATAGVYLYWSEAALKALTLLLIRASTSPLSEVALSAVLVIAAVGQQCDRVLTTPTAAGVQLRLSVPVAYHSLLTNALLKRVQDPNCYSHSQNATLKANMNLHQSTLLLMDAIFNAVIDLHSSDDLALLEQFKKQNSVKQLEAALKVFVSKVNLDLTRRMDEEERDKLSETLENIGNFIEYKKDFIKNSRL